MGSLLKQAGLTTAREDREITLIMVDVNASLCIHE